MTPVTHRSRGGAWLGWSGDSGVFPVRDTVERPGPPAGLVSAVPRTTPGACRRAGAGGRAVTLVASSDTRLVTDIEKLIKKKIDLEAIEYDEDRPRERINDGRRAWREGADSNDPRSAGSAHRREAREPREPREGREPRDYRGFRPAAVSRDPFFAKPYEPSVSDAAPAWEAAAKVPARSGISANIKPKRKVAALFKAVPATEPTSQS